jgi:diguanylate cyclase (GGDEF)-like protein
MFQGIRARDWPMRPMSKTTAISEDRRLMPAAWPLLLIVALMLAVGIASVVVVSWTRAYSGGLAIWVAAENQAAYELRAYSHSGLATDYGRFRRELNVPLLMGRARRLMQEPEPDREAIERNFRGGRIPENDISGLTSLFVLFKYHPLMMRAADIWTEADSWVSELASIGEQMRAEYAKPAPDRARIDQLMARANGVHARIAPLATEFGNTMNRAAHSLVNILLVAMPLFALLLVGGGVTLFRMLGRRAQRDAQALRVLTSQLEYQATHDPLTGLTNRRRFEALLAAAIERRLHHAATGSLLYFDLDQFKVINDTCGHAAGDELIKQVVWQAQQLAPAGSTIGRLGGDEFAVLVPACGAGEALQLAERIREALHEQRFYWSGKTFAISASIGVLELDGTLASVAEVLSAADQCCYMAKDNGRNRVQCYHPDDRAMQQRRGELHWVERLHAALDNDGFELVAQEIRPVAFSPLDRFRDKVPRPQRRFELLLRMTGADGKAVAPMAFIPAAERYGLMPRIDRWVIARACRELAMLRNDGQQLPTCMVNLSGASASDPGLADYIAHCLQDNHLEGAHLGFELTETVAVGNLSTCSALMSRLRGLGCLIALDDFGTGMSSFSYLRNLPIDLLKIDGTFVRNIANDPIDHAMVETIHRIGSIMGMRTVAEGVENEEVMAALALIGVDFAQGYHVRRPVPLVQMKEEVARSSGETSSLRRAVSRQAAMP